MNEQSDRSKMQIRDLADRVVELERQAMLRAEVTANLLAFLISKTHPASDDLPRLRHMLEVLHEVGE